MCKAGWIGLGLPRLKFSWLWSTDVLNPLVTNPGLIVAVGGGPEDESPWRIKETLGVQALVALHLRDTHPGELFACSWVACSLRELANPRSLVSRGQQDTDVKASEYLDYLYAVFTCEGSFQFYLFTTSICSGLRSPFLCPLWFLWIYALWAPCLPPQVERQKYFVVTMCTCWGHSEDEMS